MSDEEIEKAIKGPDGKYFDLVISAYFETHCQADDDKLLKAEPKYPNSAKYQIRGYSAVHDAPEIVLIRDSKLREKAIARLKEIHGFRDVWDQG